MKAIMLVAIGGAIGSVLRFALATCAAAIAVRSTWPWATLAANVVGCFLMGMAAAQLSRFDPPARDAWRALVMFGLLGGFTTFSAFALESFDLARKGSMTQVVGNVLITNAMCLAGVAAGWMLAVRPADA